MKKFRSKRGFTLAEMLMAVLILGFVSAMAAVMTTSVLSSTSTMQEVAQAEILGSEALENLQRELRFATNIEVGEGGNTLNYTNDSTPCKISCENGKITLTTTVNNESKSNELFAGVSYGNLKVTSLQFNKVNNENKIKIDVSISYGDNVLWSGSVTVRPLNANAFKSETAGA